LTQIPKRSLLLGSIALGAVLGGLILPTIFSKLNLFLGVLIGGLSAIAMIAIFIPNIANEINPKFSEQRKKRLAEIQLKSLKRVFLHPTRLPSSLGLLWAIGIFITLPFFSTRINWINGEGLIIFLPILFLFGLSGCRMIQLNEYINRHADLIRGFPAKPLGYFYMIVYWGGSIFLILLIVFPQ
jgi:hypothetical protein